MDLKLEVECHRTVSISKKVEKEALLSIAEMLSHLGLDARKPVFRVSDIPRLKPACSATETC